MSLITLQPLLAADIFETVIGAIFFILWIAAQLFGGRKNAKKKQPLPRPQQPVDMAEGLPQLRNQGMGNQGMGNQGPANQPVNQQEDALRSEVEDFLRRAQGKPPKPTPQPLRQQKPSRPPERKRPAAPLRKSPVRLKEHSLRNEGVAEHVSRHISTQDIAAHTQTLGAEVATADDQLESRLHETFDHKVGSLEHRDLAKKSKKIDMAAEVAGMLRSPEGMRQLIIANEILRRPEW